MIKLLTLNTHSLVEEQYDQKLVMFTDTIVREVPDIIALQEVNQSCGAGVIPTEQLHRFFYCTDNVTIRKDNHAYNVVNILKEQDLSYRWTWLGMKKGYGKYDEGIGVLSRSNIIETDVVRISAIDDYENWKTRKIVGIRTESHPDTWFYSVHMGWWNEEEEPFQMQWARLDAHMKKRGKVWLMGDFNSPAGVAGEGYEEIAKAGWYDSYVLAREKDSGITVQAVIDGWKDRFVDAGGMRIDQIWCSRTLPVRSSKVIFNGKNAPIVSDHYGVLVEL